MGGGGGGVSLTFMSKILWYISSVLRKYYLISVTWECASVIYVDSQNAPDILWTYGTGNQACTQHNW